MFSPNRSSSGEQALILLENIKNKLGGLSESCSQAVLSDLQEISLYINSITDGADTCLQDSSPDDGAFGRLGREMPSILYRWDVQTGRMNMSRDVERIFGARPGRLSREREWWLVRIHPDDRRAAQEKIDQAVNSDAIDYRVDYRAFHSDGSWVRIQDQAFIRRDATGKATQVQGVAFPFNQAKRNEHKMLLVNKAMAMSNIALRKSQEQFRVALSNVPVAVFETDLELRYTWFYGSWLGIDAKKLVGKRDDEVFSRESIAEFLELKCQALKNKAVVRRELLLNFGGMRRLFIVSVEPFYGSGKTLTGVIGACLDVTEQRRLEEREVESTFQLEVNRRLLERRDLERQLIASHIHDGPIQGLSSLGFTVQLARELSADSEVSGVLEKVSNGVRDLVGELREVTNELRPPGLIRFGLANAIRMGVEDFKRRQPDVIVNLAVPKSANLVPDNISLALYRIFYESMNNIVRHAQATQVSVSLVIEQDQIVLEIKDNGQGFQPPRSLVDFTRHGRYGLVLMKERAESVGGEFQIKSRQKAGTTILVNMRRTSPLVPVTGGEERASFLR